MVHVLLDLALPLLEGDELYIWLPRDQLISSCQLSDSSPPSDPSASQASLCGDPAELEIDWEGREGTGGTVPPVEVDPNATSTASTTSTLTRTSTTSTTTSTITSTTYSGSSTGCDSSDGGLCRGCILLDVGACGGNGGLLRCLKCHCDTHCELLLTGTRGLGQIQIRLEIVQSLGSKQLPARDPFEIAQSSGGKASCTMPGATGARRTRATELHEPFES